MIASAFGYPVWCLENLFIVGRCVTTGLLVVIEKGHEKISLEEPMGGSVFQHHELVKWVADAAAVVPFTQAFFNSSHSHF